MTAGPCFLSCGVSYAETEGRLVVNHLEQRAEMLSLKAERFVGNARIVRCNGTSRTKTDRREYAEDLEEVAQFLATAVQFIKDANNDT